MAQSLSQILLHVIFSTKDREPTIPNALADELYRYLASACDAHGSHAYRIGGMPDHVHIACTLPRTVAVSKLLEEVKKIDRTSWPALYNLKDKFDVTISAMVVRLQQLDLLYVKGKQLFEHRAHPRPAHAGVGRTGGPGVAGGVAVAWSTSAARRRKAS